MPTEALGGTQPGTAAARAALGDVRSVERRARRENFPVASWLLPAAVRRHLLNLYGFARLVDQAGDEAFGDRDAVLDAIEAGIRSMYEGVSRAPGEARAEPEAEQIKVAPTDPILARVADTVRAFSIPAEPFLKLIQANRQDQVVATYESFADLLDYCSLSANPVGELVLHVFEAATPENRALSDLICTGLQLAEHFQDVAEDYDAGRIYLPQEDLRRFGVFDFELGSRGASDAFCSLMDFEVARAREMLRQGAPLARRFAGTPRIAVAAFVGGGLSALKAIDRAGGDVLRGAPQASTASRVFETLRVLTQNLPQNLPLSTDVAGAYEACLEITRMQARNFYFGIRLLPADRRQALAAVYAMARRIDDIAESSLPPEDKLLALEALREKLAAPALHAGPAGADPVLIAVGHAATVYPIPLEGFGELIDGAEMDVRGTTYTSFLDLLGYCRRVGGVIGRLSLGIFDTSDRERAATLADDLGIALQLTNILRDVAEDLAMGRVYLPADDLARHGLGPGLEGPPQAVADLVAEIAERAEGWYESGLQLLPLLDDASRVCVETMAGIYHQLLRRIAADPAAVLRRRVSLPPWRKGLLAVRTLGRALG